MADDWKYDIEDFEDSEDSADDSAADSDGRATDVFGERSTAEEIEPGSPTLENTLFVALGVAIALLVILGV